MPALRMYAGHTVCSNTKAFFSLQLIMSKKPCDLTQILYTAVMTRNQQQPKVPVAVKHESLEVVQSTKLAWQDCKLVVRSIQLGQSLTSTDFLQGRHSAIEQDKPARALIIEIPFIASSISAQCEQHCSRGLSEWLLPLHHPELCLEPANEPPSSSSITCGRSTMELLRRSKCCRLVRCPIELGRNVRVL